MALQDTGISHGSHTSMHMFLLGGHSCWEELPVGKQGQGALTRRPGASHKPQGHAGGSGWGETGNTRHTMMM